MALDEEALRPYFPLKNVVNGIFNIAGKLFQLDFKPATDIGTYAEEVKAYRVFKNNTLHAILYLDFFPRANKRSGAWMTSYRGQKKGQRPHVSIVCNFTNPLQLLLPINLQRGANPFHESDTPYTACWPTPLTLHRHQCVPILLNSPVKLWKIGAFKKKR